MHANLAILRATAAMQKGGEIDEIALSIYYAPSSAHPVCFFKHCISGERFFSRNIILENYEGQEVFYLQICLCEKNGMVFMGKG